MQLNSLELLTKVLNAENIDTTLLREDLSNMEMIDHRFRMRLYKDFSYVESFHLLDRQIPEDSVVSLTDEFLLTYFILRIPEEYLPEGCLPLLFAGPMTEGRQSADDIYHIMLKNQIPEQLFHEISAFYDSIPSMETISQHEESLLHLATGLFQRTYHLEYLPMDCVLFRNNASIYKTVRDNPLMAKDSIAERYDVENKFMSAIAAGDYDRAHSLYGKLISYNIRPRAENPIRNQQHQAIILNTLCRKAAEFGGVAPLYIDNLSTRFAVLINEMYSVGDIKALIKEMTHKYCLLVKNHAMKGYSAVTKDIISYIDFHYFEDLGLNRFAEMFNISKTYLSNLFKKETGVTLTDYIHQTRMRKAITLLNSSSLPMTAVATACGYNDINYFIRIFKRTYGLSPKQYQKTVMHTDH